MEFNAFKLDYLAFSFDLSFIDEVINVLSSPCSGCNPFLYSRSSRGRFNYESSTIYFSGSDDFFTLYHGGTNNLRPFVVISGFRAELYRARLLSLVKSFPECRFHVSRVDIAYDFVSPLFSRYVTLLDIHAESMGIKSSVVGDFIRCKEGRTFYLGSRTSRFFFRLYEKGIESSGVENHLRFELEIKSDKKEVSVMVLKYLHNPALLVQQWRFYKKASEIFGISNSLVPRETIRVDSDKEFCKSVFYMFRNYNATFKKVFDSFGADFIYHLMTLDKDSINSVEDIQSIITKFLDNPPKPSILPFVDKTVKSIYQTHPHLFKES